MLRYIAGYFLIGLVMNIGWSASFTIWLMIKTKNLGKTVFYKALAIFANDYKGWIDNAMLSIYEESLLLGIIVSHILWPINVAIGLSRIPDVVEYVNAEKERV